MEERRVGRLQRERDEGVRLVARRADRVEPESLRLEPTGGVVDGAAFDAGTPGDPGLGRCAVALAGRRAVQPVDEMLLERVEVVGHDR
jgi:hypothetical protein